MTCLRAFFANYKILTICLVLYKGILLVMTSG